MDIRQVRRWSVRMSTDIPFYPEVSRKLFHLTSTITPLAYLCLDRVVVLWILAGCVALAVLVEILRHRSARFERTFRERVGFMVRRREWGRISGATYVLVAQFVSVLVFPKTVAIAVLLILGISDSAASLFGMRYGRSQFLGKSLAGSLAFFLTALAVLWIAFPDRRGVAFVAALVATLAEALPTLKLGPLELNDNVSVPLLAGAVLWALLALHPQTALRAGFAG
jgi:dolichol kinase